VKYRNMIEPDAYNALVKELLRRRDLARDRALDHAASGTIENARFHAGTLKGFDEILRLLEGD